MSKNSSLKETGQSYGQKCFSSDHPRLNIWQKVKKPSKIGQDFTKIGYLILRVFKSYCKILISGTETGLYAASPPKFDIFLIFTNFLRS